jgi:hypothetical protein
MAVGELQRFLSCSCIQQKQEIKIVWLGRVAKANSDDAATLRSKGNLSGAC